MKVKFWGTRGSVPVASPSKVRYGGNTTCQQIISDCLPSGFDLVIDGGSGIVPYGCDVLSRNGAAAHLEGNGLVSDVCILHTHYHFDHIQGLPLMPIAYMPNIHKIVAGPVEMGVGPKEMVAYIFSRPYHPVSYEEVADHWSFQPLKNPGGHALIVHPQAGIGHKPLHEVAAAEKRNGKQLKLGRVTASLDDCLVIRMLYSEHPERTISYRFEERPTGRVYVLLTDHECQAAMPQALKRHLQDANLLVMDAQYLQAKYDKVTAGFGHGTAPYCVRVANEVGAGRLGLTHHDPVASDIDVEAVLAEGHATAAEIGFDGEVFACADYTQHDV